MYNRYIIPFERIAYGTYPIQFCTHCTQLHGQAWQAGPKTLYALVRVCDAVVSRPGLAVCHLATLWALDPILAVHLHFTFVTTKHVYIHGWCTSVHGAPPQTTKIHGCILASCGIFDLKRARPRGGGGPSGPGIPEVTLAAYCAHHRVPAAGTMPPVLQQITSRGAEGSGPSTRSLGMAVAHTAGF